MLKAYFHKVQTAEHTRRKTLTIGHLKYLQHLPTYGTSGAFPFGRLTCVLSETALDLPVRGTGYPTPAPALSGRLQCGWCCFVLLVVLLLYLETFLSKFATSHLGSADQKGDRPDNDPLSHAASRPKKMRLGLRALSPALLLLSYGWPHMDMKWSRWLPRGWWKLQGCVGNKTGRLFCPAARESPKSPVRQSLRSDIRN